MKMIEDSTISFTWENSKINMTLKCLSICNNKTPASSLAHIVRDFITSYSCLHYSFMVFSPNTEKHGPEKNSVLGHFSRKMS